MTRQLFISQTVRFAPPNKNPPGSSSSARTRRPPPPDDLVPAFDPERDEDNYFRSYSKAAIHRTMLVGFEFEFFLCINKVFYFYYLFL